MPNLTIIAGCNGAGKSTFASSFLPDGQESFDYDKLYLSYYNNLPDSELRDEIARNTTTKMFETAIDAAITNNTDFCYETNFDVFPIYWGEKFKEKGFIINLIFFCVETQEIARHRVQVRTEFKGHFVDNITIDLKWKAGYKNLNACFSFFDNILIVDNSESNTVYKNILQIENGKPILMSDYLPLYFKHRLPKIYNTIKSTL